MCVWTYWMDRHLVQYGSQRIHVYTSILYYNTDILINSVRSYCYDNIVYYQFYVLLADSCTCSQNIQYVPIYTHWCIHTQKNIMYWSVCTSYAYVNLHIVYHCVINLQDHRGIEKPSTKPQDNWVSIIDFNHSCKHNMSIHKIGCRHMGPNTTLSPKMEDINNNDYMTQPSSDV